MGIDNIDNIMSWYREATQKNIYVDNTKTLCDIIHDQIRSHFDELPEKKDIVYDIRGRIKEEASLKEKLKRKPKTIKTKEKFFSQITDLIGIRILVLYPQHLKDVHNFILENKDKGNWILPEEPIAYTWDSDVKTFLHDKVGISKKKIKPKSSLYSSIHYLVKPNEIKTTPCCEIQVRTLLEETWGEIDHSFNYPKEHENKYIKNNLKALAKIISAGNKLVEGIYDCTAEK